MRASQRARARLGACFVLLLAAVGLGLQTSPASAATVTVTLGVQGPSPAHVTVNTGDVVRFVNNESTVSHTITHTAGPWSFTATIAGNGGHKDTPAFTRSATFSYRDQRNFVLPTTPFSGSIVVPASPSPTAKPGANPKPSAAPKPSAQPSAAAVPSGGPSPNGGTAVLPGLGTGQQTSTVPGQSTGPQPNLAPLPPGATPSDTPAASVSYAARGITQGSSHRYGLPAALAVVAITGMASLLVRLLLAEPAARRRRTRLDMTTEG